MPWFRYHLSTLYNTTSKISAEYDMNTDKRKTILLDDSLFLINHTYVYPMRSIIQLFIIITPYMLFPRIKNRIPIHFSSVIWLIHARATVLVKTDLYNIRLLILEHLNQTTQQFKFIHPLRSRTDTNLFTLIN